MEDRFYAHTPVEEGSEWHDLISHLKSTAELAREKGEKFGTGEAAYLAGLWHDLGKFNPEFQEYLLRCEEDERKEEPPPARGVQHAVYGAMLARDAYSPLLQPIYGHHAGLPEAELAKDRMQDPALEETFAEVKRIASGCPDLVELPANPGALIDDPPQGPLQFELLVRMLFSALVDADFLDTEAHFDPEASRKRGALRTSCEALWERLKSDQERLLGSASDTPVNRVRAEVYENCIDAAQMPQGIFRLSVPTGGGKTRSGLAFALRHAVEHDLDRVIVAVPYTSIIEQTAGEYRKIFRGFEQDPVLEHHSAVQEWIPDENRDVLEKRIRARLATQNWDAPLVVTTTVQLFESLFARRTSRCRKLHNISRSVIVLDEVQTLPLGLLGPILSVLNELVRRYGVTVVLCTATQPAFEEQSRYLKGLDPSLVEDIVPVERAREHFGELRRVEYERPTAKWSWQEIARQVREASKQAMVVVNTRKDALAVLDALDHPSALHLSTLLCGAHRRDVLDEIRRRLDNGEPCLLVSTQVVEAGVDLDFPAVFRAMGPLERIVQAAGRCNREGKAELGRVVIFEPEEGSEPRGEYASATDKARLLLRREEFDLHAPEIFREYFSQLYMSGSTDRKKIQVFRRRLDYPEVADRFRMITDDTVPVIVSYTEKDPLKEARRAELISRIQREGALRPGDHRRLQPYVVGLRRYELQQMEWMTQDIAEGVKLWIGGYDPVRGISAVSTDPADLVW